MKVCVWFRLTVFSMSRFRLKEKTGPGLGFPPSSPQHQVLTTPINSRQPKYWKSTANQTTLHVKGQRTDHSNQTLQSNSQRQHQVTDVNGTPPFLDNSNKRDLSSLSNFNFQDIQPQKGQSVAICRLCLTTGTPCEPDLRGIFPSLPFSFLISGGKDGFVVAIRLDPRLGHLAIPQSPTRTRLSPLIAIFGSVFSSPTRRNRCGRTLLSRDRCKCITT
ncbi:hypothetical protein QBC39DRAFT_73648 [Podospora conica]|nr:hypothetical protein QBC39DRAFT_73648 [Schizothecium conicum]